jgi:cation:H+ antiporter
MLELGLTSAIVLFLGSAVLIALGGTRMTNIADVLADRTGFGEALVGGVILGISTSLSGTVTSITAALDGQASLAVANAVGGIAAQTLFLAIADVVYRRANLEHAAASPINMLQATLLILMLTLPLGAALVPSVTLFAIHPVTPVLLGVYIGGLRLAEGVRAQPMWEPTATAELKTDAPEEESFAGPSTRRLVGEYTILLVILGAAGWTTATSGLAIAAATGLSQSFVGALFTAVATSLPELVTTLAAVRRGALTLAVGGIIGGNTFDVLFLLMSDVAYRNGSIYHAVGEADLFLIVWAMIMTAILLLGLVRRERHGPASIGFESTTMIGLYAGGAAINALAF